MNIVYQDNKHYKITLTPTEMRIKYPFSEEYGNFCLEFKNLAIQVYKEYLEENVTNTVHGQVQFRPNSTHRINLRFNKNKRWKTKYYGIPNNNI